MFHASLRKALLGLALSATAALSVTGSAQAAVYKGAWDPAYGAPFDEAGQELGWKGEAFWEVPNNCLPGTGGWISNGADCSSNGMRVLSAEVNFYDVNEVFAENQTEFTVLEKLTFAPDALAPVAKVDRMSFAGLQLTGVVTEFFQRKPATIEFAGIDQYDFSLKFDGSRVQLYHLWRGTLPEDTTSNLARFLSYGDDRDDDHEEECSDKKNKKDKKDKKGKKGDDRKKGDGRSGDDDDDDDDDEHDNDDCKPRLEVCPWEPGNSLNNQYCGFSSDSPTVTFTLEGQEVPQVPEPPTYALLLAGLGAAGFLAKRRRR